MGSYPYGVSPFLVQQWREEVLYLHSLWHKGPPRDSSHKTIKDNPGSSNSVTQKNKPNKLAVTNSTTFKKCKKKKKDPKPVVSEVEWPCGPDPEPPREIGWPESNPKSDQATRPATAEEQAKFAALHLQQKGLKACQEFLSSKVSSDDDDDEELVDDDSDESEQFKFFMGIFKDDSDLRSYYEKNWESGEFCCLVCCGTGKKVGKRYKSLVALVQHSTAISKTKSRAAHRAFGKSICRVLGWEIHRLPSIVLSLDGPLGQSIAKEESEVVLKENSVQEEDLQKNLVVLDDADDNDDDDSDKDDDGEDDGDDDDDDEEEEEEEEEEDDDDDDDNDNDEDDDDDGDDIDDVDGELDQGDHKICVQNEVVQGKIVETGSLEGEKQGDSKRDEELHQKVA